MDSNKQKIIIELTEKLKSSSDVLNTLHSLGAMFSDFKKVVLSNPSNINSLTIDEILNLIKNNSSKS